MLSLYGGKGGNYIEKEGIISNNQCGENLGKKKASTAVAFLVVGGAKSNKSNANNESEYVGKGSMCRDTFFLFYSVLLLYVGAEELFSLSSFKNQPPVEKVRWRATQFQFFPPEKRAEATLRFPNSSTWISYSGQSENIQPRKGGRGEKKTGS